MLLVLPIIDIWACRYYWIPSVLRSDTGYTAYWKWENKRNKVHSLMSTYWCSLSHLRYCFLFFCLFPFFFFSLSVSFEWYLMRVAGSMASRYWFLSLPFISRQNWQSYCMTGHWLTRIRTVSWRVKGEGLSGSAVWCSVHCAQLNITVAIPSISVGRHSLY